MDYQEKLLNVLDIKEMSSDENNKNIIKTNIKVGYYNDAFHHANVFSKLFFCWVNKIFKVIFKFYLLKNLDNEK